MHRVEPPKDLADLRRFHGHLGPYVVLGLRLGQYALERLGVAPHFGLEAQVRCAGNPPESCLLDGVQFATGCTLGKQNISHTVGHPITLRLREHNGGAEVVYGLNGRVVEEAVRLMREQGETAAVEFVCALRPEDLVAPVGETGR